MASRKKPNGYWTKERCYEEALKYKSRWDFEIGSCGAYQKARTNGWLDEYDWFKEKKKPNGYWNNYDHCYEEAKKYSSLTEFFKAKAAAYRSAKKNAWIVDYTWFKERVLPANNVYVVYCYYDEETNTIYVGLTNDMRVRHKQHKDGILNKGVVKHDNVWKYFHSIGKDFPEPIILKSELSAFEAQEYEEYYVDEYRNAGKNVLNKQKTGSLGTYKKWTKKACYEEALKYTSRLEFRRNNRRACETAYSNGWFADYTWMTVEQLKKPNGYWSYERCKEESAKYNRKVDFSKGNVAAYRASWKNGWLNDFFPKAA